MKKKLLILAAAMTLAFSFSMTACAQPQTMPDGTVFDAAFYAQANPDVAAVFGTDANLLYLHYVQFGKAEGRAAVSGSAAQTAASNNAVEEFDAAFYVQAYPDVAAALGTDPAILYQHYIQFGKAEGRIGKAPAISVEEQYEKRILELVNEERSKAGIAPLVWDDAMARAADIRAVELSQLYSHTRPDGRDCLTALDEQGVFPGDQGENIYATPLTPEAAMRGWMNSPGHRSNIMWEHFKRIGVGYYMGDKPYWVQLFSS